MEQQELANENKIQEMLREKKGFSVRNDVTSKIANISAQQEINTNVITNLTKQLSDFDKLHLSMLELLENVETIEAKVDKSIPELRREISKLEVQVSEALATGSLLREDQRNIMNSLKAVTFTVSTMQDKTNEDHERLGKVDEMVQNLVKSNTLQTSKLHDHILKEPILAKCESGWTTVQRRYDGSINFNRNWNEYSNGFGSATGEHWLGNKHLHLLTKENCSRLQINMKDIYGQYWQANYDDFRVADYQNGFRYNLGLTWFDNSRNEWIAVAESEMRVKRRDVC
nr:unnamed protein product [Callosobruchus analis]